MMNQDNRTERQKARQASSASEPSSLEFGKGLRNDAKLSLEAVLFIGIQGSGKSSLFRDRFAATHSHINRDTLKTKTRQQAALETCVQEGKSFVVDNTNPSAEVRRQFIELAKAHNYKVIGYYFDVPLKEALQRNSQRPKETRVPPPGVIATYRKLEIPAFAEGFDELYNVIVAPGGGFTINPVPKTP